MGETRLTSRPGVIVRPGKSVRFAVIAEDGRRSMPWTVWTSRHTLDAYLTARPLSGQWKLSMHETGSWQSGLTKEWAETIGVDMPTRHMDLWQRPEEFAPGMRRGVQLTVPDAELRRWPEGATDDKPLAVTIPTAGAGHAACIEFIFMAGPQMLLDLQEPIFDVAALTRHDGSALRVVSRQTPWTAEDAERIRVYKTAMLAAADPEMLRQLKAPRGLIVGHHVDGIRFVVDVAGDLGSP